MHLAQDNNMVYALTPDRSDQPFGKAILPGRGRCGRLCAVRRCREKARAEGELRRLPDIVRAHRMLWNMAPPISMAHPSQLDANASRTHRFCKPKVGSSILSTGTSKPQQIQ